MGEILRKSIEQPDESRTFEKGRVAVVNLGDAVFSRVVFEPGWRWSECVKPIVGGDSCQHHHRTFVLSGRLHVVLDDGTESDIGPGDVVDIPPGHDGWVVGDEACVTYDFDATSRDYAKAQGS